MSYEPTDDEIKKYIADDERWTKIMKNGTQEEKDIVIQAAKEVIMLLKEIDDDTNERVKQAKDGAMLTKYKKWFQQHLPECKTQKDAETWDFALLSERGHVIEIVKATKSTFGTIENAVKYLRVYALHGRGVLQSIIALIGQAAYGKIATFDIIDDEIKANNYRSEQPHVSIDGMSTVAETYLDFILALAKAEKAEVLPLNGWHDRRILPVVRSPHFGDRNFIWSKNLNQVTFDAIETYRKRLGVSKDAVAYETSENLAYEELFPLKNMVFSWWLLQLETRFSQHVDLFTDTSLLKEAEQRSKDILEHPSLLYYMACDTSESKPFDDDRLNSDFALMFKYDDFWKNH